MRRSDRPGHIFLIALAAILVLASPACSSGGAAVRLPAEICPLDASGSGSEVDAEAGDAPCGGEAPIDSPAGDATIDSPPGDTGAPSATGPTRFVLRNATGRTIHLQAVGFGGPEYWYIQRNGQYLPVLNTCEVCDCSECPECSACGRRLAQVTQIEPGATHSFEWDGRVWIRVPSACRVDRMCEADQWVAAGPLAVRIIYSHSSRLDTSHGSNDQLINEPYVSVTADFSHPTSEIVEIVANQ